MILRCIFPQPCKTRLCWEELTDQFKAIRTELNLLHPVTSGCHCSTVGNSRGGGIRVNDGVKVVLGITYQRVYSFQRKSKTWANMEPFACVPCFRFLEAWSNLNCWGINDSHIPSPNHFRSEVFKIFIFYIILGCPRSATSFNTHGQLCSLQVMAYARVVTSPLHQSSWVLLTSTL